MEYCEKYNKWLDDPEIVKDENCIDDCKECKFYSLHKRGKPKPPPAANRVIIYQVNPPKLGGKI